MAKSELEKRLEELERLRERGVVTPEEYESRRAAVLADTSLAGKQGSRGSGIFKWGLLGCFGIFAAIGLFVIVVIVLIAAAVGGAADDKPGSGGDVHVALADGASGAISPEHQGSRQVKVTVLHWRDGASSENQFLQPEDGKKYVSFEVVVENVGDREVGVLDWKLRDSKDHEYDRRFVSGLGNELEAVFNLTPGGKVTGLVVFEIEADASVKWLRADPNLFAKNDLYFDAR